MASPNVINLTASNFQAEVLNSPVPVLVDFWAPWCGPCIQLAPVIDQIADERAGKVKVAKLDVAVEENQALAGGYQVRGIPALIFFKGGQPVANLVGLKPKAEILSKLDSLV